MENAWGIWFVGDESEKAGWCRHNGRWYLYDSEHEASETLAGLEYLRGCAEVRRFSDHQIADSAREYVAALDSVLDAVVPAKVEASLEALNAARNRLVAAVKEGK